MADKYLKNSAGQLAEQSGTVSSAGAANAGNIVALDATGRLDTSVMPVGIAAQTATILTSEALAAGDFVNVYNAAGVVKCRKADASATGKEARGFVLASVASGAQASVYLTGSENTQVTGATGGEVFLSDVTPGGFTSTAPTTTGHVVQSLGTAVSATTIAFSPTKSIALA